MRSRSRTTCTRPTTSTSPRPGSAASYPGQAWTRLRAPGKGPRPREREAGAAMATQTTDPESTDLKRGLKQRHLTMIAIGGVIGAGLFVGSGAVMNEAGSGGLPQLPHHRRAHHPRDADARRDGDREPVDRLLRRLRAARPRRLGRLLGRLALLVLLGDRRRLRGDGRREDHPVLVEGPGSLDARPRR